MMSLHIITRSAIWFELGELWQEKSFRTPDPLSRMCGEGLGTRLSYPLAPTWLVIWYLVLVGVNMSKPHTSVTALHMSVCVYVCLFAWTKCARSMSTETCTSAQVCSIGVKENNSTHNRKWVSWKDVGVGRGCCSELLCAHAQLNLLYLFNVTLPGPFPFGFCST